ncbi:unnamed protein product [Allacma fusca]|uniref:Major facilitator superfamily (MFS) profile domain-containing protein n=1 Tax=Allacma fusca TaxID=39272 RepID=A0A8J2L0W9_9HEXA|nr:unnamed protein product [Allacma fusca]
MAGDEEKEQSNPKGIPRENFISSSKGFDGVFDLVGGSNLFQWLLFSIVCIQGVVLVNHHLGFVFLGAVPAHWCQVGELSSSPWTLDQIKNISIPRKTPLEDGTIVWENCDMYDMNYTELVSSGLSFDEVYQSINFSALSTKVCSEWAYDRSIYEDTVVSEFNLVCGRRHLVASIQASYMVGVLVGSLVLGSLSDKLLGRRKAILASVTLIMLSGLAAAFAKSFIAFSFFRFLVAVGVSGSYQNCYVLLLEHSDKSYRSLLGIIQQMPFAVGYMTIPLFAYFLRRWDHLQLSFAVTSFALLAYFWLLPESPRWLASVGRDDEAIEKLHSIAKWNKRPLPDKNVLLPILRTCREEETDTQKRKFLPGLWHDLRLTSSNYLNLIKTPELRRRSFAIWALFSFVALVYYGVVMDSATFSSDPFLMVFLGGLMEVPAYSLTEPFVSKWGRRPTLILLFALTGAVFLAFVATPVAHQHIRILFAMSGKLFVSSAFAVIYLLGAELYPTSARITGLGAAVLMGRFGSIIAPYAVDMLQPIYRDLPTLIFGIVAFFGAAVACFLPETKDLEMTDLVTEVEERAQPASLDMPFIRRSSKATVEAPTLSVTSIAQNTK